MLGADEVARREVVDGEAGLEGRDATTAAPRSLLESASLPLTGKRTLMEALLGTPINRTCCCLPIPPIKEPPRGIPTPLPPVEGKVGDVEAAGGIIIPGIVIELISNATGCCACRLRGLLRKTTLLLFPEERTLLRKLLDSVLSLLLSLLA